MKTVDPRVMASALRGFNVSPIVNGPIPATGLARIKDTRLRNADRLSQFDAPMIATSAGGAALGGVARGIAKYLQQQRGEKDLEAAYSQYEAAERAMAEQEAQRAAAAAEAANTQKMREMAWQRGVDLEDEQRKRENWKEDKQWEWANKPVDQLSPQDLLQMQQTQAQIASIMQQMNMREDDNRRKEDKAGREAAEAESAAADKANTNALIADNIDYLLDPENKGAMNSATGPIDSRLPTLRQGTADWENAFEFVKSGLTSDIMDMMTGVLSESDIKMLKSIAAGGIDLSSSPERIVPTLERFRSALRGSAPTEASGPPEGVSPEIWAVMTPEEKAAWQ